jgi:hypothetical protein
VMKSVERQKGAAGQFACQQWSVCMPEEVRNALLDSKTQKLNREDYEVDKCWVLLAVVRG